MTRNYSQALSQVNFKEPKVLVRGALGLLLVANIVAAVFAFHLIGDSPAALDEQLSSAQTTFRAAQQHLNKSKSLIQNMATSRDQGDKFLASYMTSRKHTYSTIDTELNKLAETAGMKVGDLNYSLPDQIEGSGDLDSMTITANFEGNYSQLVKFVNLLDRSPRFLLIDSLQVAPQPKGDILSATVKLNTFIKDDQEGATVKLTLGAEPKKVGILIVLVVVALAGLYFNSGSDSSPSPAPRAAAVNPVPAAGTPARGPAVRARGAVQANGEFRLRVPGSRPDDAPVELTSIDPALRLDLLAKVQAVPPIEAGRNLFQFGAAPAPPASLKPIPTGVPVISTKTPPPPPPPPTDAGNRPPVQPQPPPINFKYYGYKVSKTDGHKEAFLLDGEDIIVAQENQMVKVHYKIVRIALNAITIEDTQSNSTQTLNLQDLPS